MEVKQKISQLEKAKTNLVQRCDCSELDKLKKWYEQVKDVNLVNLSEQEIKIPDFQKEKDRIGRKNIIKKVIENTKSF